MGTAALIIVLSIFNGFQKLTEENILGFDPNISIYPKSGAWIENADSVVKLIKQNFPDLKIAPVSNVRVAALNGSNMQLFNMLCISTQDRYYFSDLIQSTVFGNFSLEDTGKTPTIVLGSGISDRLSTLPSDTLNLVSPKLLEQYAISPLGAQKVSAVVSGIFHSKIKENNDKYAFAPPKLAAMLTTIPNGAASTIDIRLDKFGGSEDLALRLAVIIGNKYEIKTWQDLNADLYQVMKFERMSVFAVLSIIVILAVFNVLASLSMTVIEKETDIASLMSMGLSRKGVRQIFIWEGIIIGVISTFGGLTIGLGLCFAQIQYEFVKVSSSNYIINYIPVAVKLSDVLIVGIFSLALAVAATLYPASRASATEISRALRNE